MPQKQIVTQNERRECMEIWVIVTAEISNWLKTAYPDVKTRSAAIRKIGLSYTDWPPKVTLPTDVATNKRMRVQIPLMEFQALERKAGQYGYRVNTFLRACAFAEYYEQTRHKSGD